MNIFILLLIASHSFFVIYAWSLRQELRETQAELDEYVNYIGDEFAAAKERGEIQMERALIKAIKKMFEENWTSLELGSSQADRVEAYVLATIKDVYDKRGL